MPIPPLDANAKEWIQAASWIAAIAAGIFGITKILVELKQSRLQRAQELRWKKAQAAKSLNDELLDDKKASAAMTMLDWTGREFEISQGRRAKISHEAMLRAMRTENVDFSDEEAFIRDSFDNFFYFLGIFEQHILRGLVDFPDLEYPTEYYVKLMTPRRVVFEPYLKRYGFSRTLGFLDRFEVWRQATSSTQLSSPKVSTSQSTDKADGR